MLLVSVGCTTRPLLHLNHQLVGLRSIGGASLNFPDDRTVRLELLGLKLVLCSHNEPPSMIVPRRVNFDFVASSVPVKLLS